MSKFRYIVTLAAIAGLIAINCTKKSSNPVTTTNAGPYDLTFSLTGMTPHLGQLMVFNVIDVGTNAVVVDTDIVSVPSASFALDFGKVIKSGHSYRIDFFADLNKNGLYNAPPVDHAWRIQLPMIGSDTTVNFAHNTNFTDIVYPQEAVHTLMMSFTGMTPHIGQLMVINVIDSVYNTVVIDTDIIAVPSANFTLNLGKKLVDGRSYLIDFFADLNKNGLYDAPPVDHAWRIPLGKISGDTTVTFTHNTNFTDIKYPLEAMDSLTMSFTGMTPHVGQMMRFRVIDSVYNSVIKDTTLAAVPSADFQVSFGKVLVDGRSYRIDFYADLNTNGTYDPPPVDHAWRLQIGTAKGTTVVPFAHNTNFIDIGPL